MRTRDWAVNDYYALLDIAPTATTDEVAQAFRTLAKQLHPDRPQATEPEVERFKSVTAAYEVLGNERLRRNYDQVRIEQAALTPTPVRRVDGGGSVAASSVAPTTEAVALSPAIIRRNGRRWLAGGIGVLFAGILVTVLVVHLQMNEHTRRAGRVKTEAVLEVSAAGNRVRFRPPGGAMVSVPEPTRVDPGTEHDGQRIAVLYRPDRPTDVILDESTAARDITLWIVALKMLVGGTVFLVVGVRRLMKARMLTSATV